jgi:polysaccharide export outer membrane protein
MCSSKLGQFVLGTALVMVSAVASAQGVAPPAAASASASAAANAGLPDDYVVGAEDVLAIQFWREPDMSGDVTVRPDGKITLPLIGEIVAVGKKPEVLRDDVQKAAGRFLADANVSIIVKQVNSRKVFITGQVTHPGEFSLAGPKTVLQLIAQAGGLTEYADGDKITVMRAEQGETRLFKFNYKDVSRGKALQQNIQLKPGDTVVVP